MKKFEVPAMDIEKLEIADVITTSITCEVDGGDISGCSYDTGR